MNISIPKVSNNFVILILIFWYLFFLRWLYIWEICYCWMDGEREEIQSYD